ncbi:MAG: carboxymuconolactone decarboxylase family protein [Acidobacteriota bacterium]
MTEEQPLISVAFHAFMQEAPGHSKVWGEMVQGLSAASALDKKTSALAYLSVLAAVGLQSGVPFHARAARENGASREEVISAVLLGLPAAGHGVTRSLPAALEAYDGS